MGFRKDGSISLWLCVEKHNENTGDDPLKSLFGIDYYDLDELEVSGLADWSLLPIESIVSQLSYSASFKDAAIERAQGMSIKQARRVIALYNFAYDPSILVIELPNEPRFLGAFEWTDDC